MVTLLAQITESPHVYSENLIYWGSIVAIVISVLNLIYSIKVMYAIKRSKEGDDVVVEIQQWNIISNLFKLVVGVPSFIIGGRLIAQVNETAMQADNQVYAMFILSSMIIIMVPTVRLIGDITINAKLREQNERNTNKPQVTVEK